MNKALGVFLSCCLLSCGAAVERQVPTEYATIQQAIDAAQDGDVVIVQPGTYYEHVRFKGKAITVRAADLSSWDAVQGTMIAGWRTTGSCAVFDQGETHASVLEGFTLFGAREGSRISSGTGQFDAGGGVLCVNLARMDAAIQELLSMPCLIRPAGWSGRAPGGGSRGGPRRAAARLPS